MNSVLVKMGLGWLAKKMNGYKTYAGATGKVLAGIASVATGIAGIIQYLFPEEGVPAIDPEVQIGMIMAGFYAVSSGLQGLGIGHKIEKAQQPAYTTEMKVGNVVIKEVKKE